MTSKVWHSSLFVGLCGEADAFELFLVCLPPAHLQQTVHVPESHLWGSAGNIYPTLISVSLWLYGCFKLWLSICLSASKGTKTLNCKHTGLKVQPLLISLLCNKNCRFDLQVFCVCGGVASHLALPLIHKQWHWCSFNLILIRVICHFSGQ